ncbi:MAG: BON domain-containing protein [Candidimonas sp.]|nr:MAG: BON domain-containing protein [Candidimonas sp.]
MTNPFSRHVWRACAAAVVLVTLSGCGAVVLGGAAASTAVVATDRRTAGTQLDDQTIEIKVGNEMLKHFDDKARVNATSYNGWVLLTGDVPTQQDKQQAESITSRIPKVRKVINALRVGSITPLSVRTNDTWITSMVKANLIDTKGVPSRTISVTTERGIVYLMGIVTDAEAQRAAIASASVDGVNKVVKLFEIVSPQSLQQRTSPAPIQDNSTSPTHTPTPSAPAEGVQVMPVK